MGRDSQEMESRITSLSFRIPFVECEHSVQFHSLSCSFSLLLSLSLSLSLSFPFDSLYKRHTGTRTQDHALAPFLGSTQQHSACNIRHYCSMLCCLCLSNCLGSRHSSLYNESAVRYLLERILPIVYFHPIPWITHAYCHEYDEHIRHLFLTRIKTGNNPTYSDHSLGHAFDFCNVYSRGLSLAYFIQI